VLFLINNMYLNPQLANYIHTRSLSASVYIWSAVVAVKL